MTQVRDAYSSRIVSVKAEERERRWQALPEELQEHRRLTQASFGSGDPVPTTLSKREHDAAAEQLARRARESRNRTDPDRSDRGR